MSNEKKEYFIPVDGNPIEVSEEVYRAYYQPVWNARYHAQKNGECRCTKAQLWKCDGVCPGCPFYAAGKKVSIDTPIGGEDDELTLGDTLADDVPTAESILMDCMKTQIFNDGNKRASVIFANHYMISKGQGLIVIPESHVPEFKRLLVAYYEDRDNSEIVEFMRTKCWRTF